MFIPKKYLTETIILLENTDFSSTMKTLTQSNPPNKDDPNFEYYKQLANWANNGRRQYKDGISLEKSNTKIQISDRSLIDKEPHKLETFYGSFHGLLDRLNILMQKEGKFGQNAELSKLIQQTTVEILASLSGIKNPKPDGESAAEGEEELDTEPKSDPESDPKVKSGGGRDWTAYRAKKLASANGNTAKALNEFYDEYYSQEFAGVESPEKDTKGIVAKLKSLDKILIPEFNKLGYNPEVNPFASFLKILIKKESDIFDKLTYNTYGAIHNSFIEKHITGNMLGQKFDEANILFCSDLYNKNGLDIVSYLDLQNQALAAKEKSENATDSTLIAKIFIHQNIPTEQDGKELSYSTKVEKLRNLTEVVQPGDKDAKLKSLLEIRELYKYIFGEAAETAGNKQKFNLQIKAYIVDDAEKRGHLLNMIDYILDQAVYAESRAYAEEARQVETWLAKINYREDKEKKRTVKNVLSNYTLSATEYHDLIVNLQNRAEERLEGKK